MSEFWGEDGFTLDDIGGIFDIAGEGWGLVEEITGDGSDTEYSGDDYYSGPSEEPTDYTIWWIVGGVAVIILAVVLIYLAKKRK